jgi:hypothetical protein
MVAVIAEDPAAPGPQPDKWASGLYIVALALAYWIASTGRTAAALSDTTGLTVLVLLTLLAQFAEHVIEPIAPAARAVLGLAEASKANFGLVVASATTLLGVFACAHYGLYLLDSLGWKEPGNTTDAFLSGVALSGGTKLLHAIADTTKK